MIPQDFPFPLDVDLCHNPVVGSGYRGAHPEVGMGSTFGGDPTFGGDGGKMLVDILLMSFGAVGFMTLGLILWDSRRKVIQAAMAKAPLPGEFSGPQEGAPSSPEYVVGQILSDLRSVGLGENSDYRIRIRESVSPKGEKFWVLELGTSVRRLSDLETARLVMLEHARSMLSVLKE